MKTLSANVSTGKAGDSKPAYLMTIEPGSNDSWNAINWATEDITDLEVEARSDGAAAGGSTQFDSAGATFETRGVLPGDELLIDGDASYVVASIDSETRLQATANINAGDPVVYHVQRDFEGGRIRKGGLGTITKEVDLFDGGNIATVSDFSFEILNQDDFLNSTSMPPVLEGRNIDVRLLFTDGSGQTWPNALRLHKFTIEVVDYDTDVVRFTCTDASRARFAIDLPQTAITVSDFADVHPSNIGKPRPLTYGNFDSINSSRDWIDAGLHKALLVDQNLRIYLSSDHLADAPGAAHFWSSEINRFALFTVDAQSASPAGLPANKSYHTVSDPRRFITLRAAADPGGAFNDASDWIKIMDGDASTFVDISPGGANQQVGATVMGRPTQTNISVRVAWVLTVPQGVLTLGDLVNIYVRDDNGQIFKSPNKTAAETAVSVITHAWTRKFVVSAGVNDAIDFKEGGGGELNATLSAATYSATDLAIEIDTQLTAAGAGAYTVSYSLTTFRFTITKSATTIQILWNSGTNSTTNAANLLGFDKIADTSAAIAQSSNFDVVGAIRDISDAIVYADYTTGAGAGNIMRVETLQIDISNMPETTRLTEVYTSDDGIAFGSWIDTAGRVNNYNAGNLIEPGVFAVESMLRDHLSLGDSDIDYVNFDTLGDSAAGTRKDEIVAFQMLQRRNPLKWISDLCFNIGILYFTDHDNKETVRAIDLIPAVKQFTTADYEIEPSSKKSTLRVRKTPLNSVFNDIEVLYFKNYHTNEYEKRSFCNKDGKSSGVAAGYDTKCSTSFTNFGFVRKLTVESDYIRDDDTADFLVQWLVDWFYLQKRIANFTSMIQNVDVELGDMTTPTHSRIYPSGNAIATKIAHNLATDEISFELVDHTHDNKVSNGDLESLDGADDFSDWTEANNGTSSVNDETSTQHGGDHAARFDLDGTGNYAAIVHNPNLTLVVDTQYTLTFYNKSSVLTTSIAVGLQNTTSSNYLQSDGSWAAAPTSFGVPASLSWVYFSINFTTEGAGTAFVLELKRSGSIAGASIYIDDITIF